MKKIATGIYYNEKTKKYFINYWDIDSVARRRMVKGATCLADAQKALAEKKLELMKLRDEPHLTASEKKVKELDEDRHLETIDEVAELYFNANLSKGVDAQRKRYEKWIRPTMGSVVHPMSKDELSEFRNWLIGSEVKRGSVSMPMANKTINIIVTLLGSILKWSDEEGYALYPKGVPKLKSRLALDNDRQRTLSLDEADMLFESLDYNAKGVPKHKRSVMFRNYLVVSIGLYTGARPASYLDLRVKDIFMGSSDYGKQIPVQLKFTNRKGAKAYEIPVLPELVPVLEMALAGGFDRGILSPNDKLIKSSYSAIQQSLGVVFDRLFNVGLDGYDMLNKVSLYTLRHSAATILYRATGNIYLVSQMLGHHSVVTTQRYIKTSVDMLADGMAKGLSR